MKEFAVIAIEADMIVYYGFKSEEDAKIWVAYNRAFFPTTTYRIVKAINSNEE